MKHILLLLVLAVGCLAAQASAGMFTLDTSTALKFTHFTMSPGDSTLGAPVIGPTTDTFVYGASMRGTVGWAALLSDGSGDKAATMTISAGGNANLSGSFSGFRAFFANDNDDPWGMQLFVQTGGTRIESGFVTLTHGQSAYVTLNAPFDFSNVTDFGFEVQGNFTDGSPSNGDFFHVSAVPIPGAALLGVFGLMAAGLKLRKYA